MESKGKYVPEAPVSSTPYNVPEQIIYSVPRFDITVIKGEFGLWVASYGRLHTSPNQTPRLAALELLSMMFSTGDFTQLRE